MPRWVFIGPLMAVMVAGIALALLLGWRVATTTETAVIEKVADLYVADAGDSAARTDCAARPAASDGLWLVVTCAAHTGQGVDYFVDRYGRIVDRTPHAEGT
ncbi:MAG: hypothetical protein AB8B82_06120 [Roseovarius sp.]